MQGECRENCVTLCCSLIKPSLKPVERSAEREIATGKRITPLLQLAAISALLFFDFSLRPPSPPPPPPLSKARRALDERTFDLREVPLLLPLSFPSHHPPSPLRQGAVKSFKRLGPSAELLHPTRATPLGSFIGARHHPKSRHSEDAPLPWLL